MVERTEQVSRDRDRDDAGGVRSRLGGGVRSRVGGLLSVRTFLASLAVLAAGLVVGDATLPVVGGLVGMLAAGVVVGVAGGRIVETAVAGGAVAALSLLLYKPVLSLALGFGVPVAVVGGGSGLLVAGFGAYLGRDLRDGLTREL